MKKVLLFLAAISLVALSFGQAQNVLEYKGAYLSVTDLVTECGTSVIDTVIKYVMSDAPVSTPKIVYEIKNKFGNSYLMEILLGDIAGKDTNVVRFIQVITADDQSKKVLLRDKLFYERNKADLSNVDNLIDSLVYVYRPGLESGITGRLLFVSKTKGIVIVEPENNNVYKCDMYTVRKITTE